MKQLGYYAKDKANNLHQFEWGANEEFSILNRDGDYEMVDPNDYEILNIGVITSDDFNKESNEDRELYNLILIFTFTPQVGK